MCIFGALSPSLSFAEIKNTETKVEVSNKMVNQKEKVKYYNNMFEIGAGISYGSSSYEFDEPTGYKINNNVSLDDNGIVYDLNVRYKIYLDKYKTNSSFLAPEIFYSFGSFEANDGISGTNLNVGFKVEPRFGFKISYGFEIENKYSFSMGAGVQFGSYDYHISELGASLEESGNYWAPFLGLDYQYNIVKNAFVGINFQYYFAGIDLDESGLVLGVPPFQEKIDKVDGNYFTIGLKFGGRF